MITQEKQPPVEHEKMPYKGAYSGLHFGMLAVPILVVPGTLLCLTGLGAFFGVPMIILAIFAPLLGPMIVFGAVRGKCPWCGAQVSCVGHSDHLYCHACSQEIIVMHHEFVRAA